MLTWKEEYDHNTFDDLGIVFHSHSQFTNVSIGCLNYLGVLHKSLEVKFGSHQVGLFREGLGSSRQKWKPIHQNNQV